MNDVRAEIQAMVDRETAAWDAQDADALVDLFHSDMVWPWPPDAASHDPATWVLPMGRYDRARWRASWLELGPRRSRFAGGLPGVSGAPFPQPAED